MIDWREIEPKVTPIGWHRIAETVLIDGGSGAIYENTNGCRAIVSTNIESDGRQWLHVSVSRRNRLPSWDEFKSVKEWLIGNDRVAVQIFPRRVDYIDHHPYVLHLWCVLDGPDPVPRFNTDPRRMGSI